MKFNALYSISISALLLLGCAKESIKEEESIDANQSESISASASYSTSGEKLGARNSYESNVNDFFNTRGALYLQPTGITFTKNATLENNLESIKGFNIIYN